MNLLSFAAAGMAPSMGGGGGGGDPPSSAEITVVVDAATGQPKADPDSAWVKPGGTITWKSAVPFEIVLKLMWSDVRVSRKSKGGVVEVTAGSVNGRYSYGIKVEGAAEVDPDVVIGPKSGG